MRKSRYTDGQILAILQQNDNGVPVPELCREHGMSSAQFYMRLKHMNEWHPNGRSYLTFAANGSLQTADDVRRRSVGYQVAQMIYPVHIAYVGGLWWFLLALAGGGGFVSASGDRCLVLVKARWS